MQHCASDTSFMLDLVESPWARSRWAVIKDARRRQRRRQCRFLAAATSLLAVAGGVAVTRPGSSGHGPAPAPEAIGTVRELTLDGAVQDTTTLDGHLWALTCRRHCSEPLSTKSTGQLVELSAFGTPIRSFSVRDPTVLTSGAGVLWVAHFATGDVSRMDPRTGAITALTHIRLAHPISTSGYRRFLPAAISFGAHHVWISDGAGFVAELNPTTARVNRIVFTSSEATSSTSAAGLTWVADELAGVGTFAADSEHVATHPIYWAGQPVDVATVEYGAGVIWALGEEANYMTGAHTPPSVGVLTTLNPRTGQIVDQWPLSTPVSRRRDGGAWSASGLVVGNGAAYLGTDRGGRLLRLFPSRGLQILHGPRGVQLTAVTSHALWAINQTGKLLRIGLVRR